MHQILFPVEIRTRFSNSNCQNVFLGRNRGSGGSGFRSAAILIKVSAHVLSAGRGGHDLTCDGCVEAHPGMDENISRSGVESILSTAAVATDETAEVSLPSRDQPVRCTHAMSSTDAHCRTCAAEGVPNYQASRERRRSSPQPQRLQSVGNFRVAVNGVHLR